MPQTLRATVRWMVVVLLPVAMAPYWNLVGEVMGRQMAFSGIVGVMVRRGLCGSWVVGWLGKWIRVRSHDVTLRHVTSRRRLVTWPSNVTSGEGPGDTLPGMDHTYGRFGKVVTTRILNVTVT